ncbi:histidine kinase dimerization/phospho-acceptor domain-containing protein [Agrobacterium tumefaciens]|uniref:histidine kinase dimerization/phospho-acceptor domain-containing protein n=1 Tax=Agrobacterium tumefaciens TaxID=358 RepID=UPI0022438861|nr:histidine kinase dimerization/phospho-acceptor domain-containing protein [Agrobacterium tumefaciens]MCW8059666.1 hypothetical protein [Agrobacterium tumefaciens]MCW8146232.1 hypothetical protein [Agrobacterium tumefaciens]
MADAVRMKRFLNITATLAHQLNNDLAAVLGYAEILADETNEDEAANTYAMEILVGGRSVRSTVERFHMLHRLASAEVFPFDARQVIDRTRNALLSRPVPGLRLTVDTPEASLTLNGHPKDLEPVLRELCDAAIGSISYTGALHITSDFVDVTLPKHLSHGVLSEGEYVRITIQATADGVIPADIEPAEYATINDHIRPGKISGELIAARSAIYLIDGVLHTLSQPNRYSQTEIYLPSA